MCNRTALLHMFEHSDEEVNECIRRLRRLQTELLNRQSENATRVSKALSNLASHATEMWEVQKTYSVVPNIIGTEFIYVCKWLA